MLDKEEIEAISAAISSLKIDLGSQIKVSLFGSRARRDHRADSDYDLLCVIPDDTPRDIDCDAIVKRADAAMKQAVQGADLNVQLLAESALEDAYFNFDFMRGAMDDGIDAIDLIRTYREGGEPVFHTNRVF